MFVNNIIFVNKLNLSPGLTEYPYGIIELHDDIVSRQVRFSIEK